MKTKNLKSVLVLAMILLFIQSCNEDDSFIIPEEEAGSLSNETTQLIVDWNELWLELDQYTSGMRPNATARALAYIHLATYETSVFSMTDYSSNVNRLSGLNINNNERSENVDLRLAINSCYASVINHFMFSVTIDKNTRIQTLEEQKESELSNGLSSTVISDSKEWGIYIAQQVIAYSQTDTEAEVQILDPQPYSYEPPAGEGYWTYSDDAERAWFPYWQDVRTFVISNDETSSVPPPISYSEETSSAFYTEMNDVYEISTAARDTDNEDLWVSEFWSDDVEGLMISPPGRQISIAKQLIEQNDLDHESTIELLLKLGFSLNDAAVSTWSDKYEYMVMRPSVYIQEFIDPDYQTNLYRFINWPNPSFPGYPSGHSAFSSAAAGVLVDEFGNDMDFTDRTHEGRTEFRGAPRQFNSIRDMAEEAAFSRVPFGVHVKMDCTEGFRLGFEISDAVNNFDLSSN